jgi:RNA polymerase sigma-54 factor
MGKQGLSQSQRLSQVQKLSPQQIMLMKLLQIPTMALEQRIKQEIEENPALDDTGETDDELNENQEEEYENELDDKDSDEFDFSDYLGDDDTPSYKLQTNNYSKDDERKEIPYASGSTFHDHLIAQLGLRQLDEKQISIATTIIGNLDDSGYLQRELSAMVDDMAFTQNVMTTTSEILEVLRVIQELDPAGVGARNLKECLLIQLQRKKSENPGRDLELPILIVDRYFNEFTKKHYDKILKKAKIDDKQLKAAVEEILKLNPKPGNSMGETTKTNQYVSPDFMININDGKLELTLNSRNTPELRLSRTYLDMLEAYSADKNKKSAQKKEAIFFVKRKIDSAKWFIDAIKQRQNTLYVTMEAIMNYQKEYFLTGDETKLRPMILKDIADIVHLDISTISRVANSKYAQTPYGTFLLKTFFSEKMQTDSGEEVSTREIKKILHNCVDGEDKVKPLTDEQLTGILKEKGYNIARRTVAKYREQLSIPVARLRKELK